MGKQLNEQHAGRCVVEFLFFFFFFHGQLTLSFWLLSCSRCSIKKSSNNNIWESGGKDRKGHVIPTKVVEGLGVYIQISLSLSLCIYTPLLFRYMSQLRAEDGPSKSSQQPRLASHSQLAFGPVWKSRTCATLVTSLPNSFCPFRKSKQKKKTFLFFSRTKWQYVLFPLFFY